MKTKLEICRNWLPRYTGTALEDFADYILGAYKKVEEYSGMKYGQPYLDQLKTKTLWSSSVKPSIALETFKAFNTKDVVAFSHAIQLAYFVDGKDLRDEEVYKFMLALRLLIQTASEDDVAIFCRIIFIDSIERCRERVRDVFKQDPDCLRLSISSTK